MMNKVIVCGHLGADPRMHTFESGGQVCELRVATSERWTNKNGEKQEHTEWFTVKVFGKQAASCGEYLSKGRPVLVEGSQQTRKYEDKDGNDRYITELKAQRVQFLGGKNGNKAPANQGSFEMEEDGDDDIPF